MECDVSWSVETVGAIDLAPAVGGGRPSTDEERGDDDPTRSREVALPLRSVEKE